MSRSLAVAMTGAPISVSEIVMEDAPEAEGAVLVATIVSDEPSKSIWQRITEKVSSMWERVKEWVS